MAVDSVTREPDDRGAALSSVASARETLPQYAAAIDANDVPFSMLFTCHYNCLAEFTADPDHRGAYLALSYQIRRAFEAKHGAIRDQFWCQKLRAGAVITARDEFHSIVNWEGSDTDIAELLRQCENIEVRSRRLPSDDRKTCLELTYAAYTVALDALNSSHEKPNESLDSTIALLKRQISDAETSYVAAAKRQANFAYFQGMLIGMAIVAFAIAIGLSSQGFQDFVTNEFPAARVALLLATLGAGALGAILSVLTRWTTGSLQLDHEAGPTTVRLLGIFRPVVGALFGGALNVVIAAGLLPIKVPEEVATQRNFVLALAIAAGFSERWAQDMLRPPSRDS